MRIYNTLLFFFFWFSLSVAAQKPVPAFSADAVAGCSPMVVNFTDASTGKPTSWSWDFGNGATSTLQNPSSTFFTPGTYTVTLTVSNANGSQTETKTNYITVYAKPEVRFTANDSVGCFPFPVQFTDASTATTGTVNTAWAWDFGDGTQSNQRSPKTKYTDAGNYTVSLKVTNDKGCWSSATKQSYIKVQGGLNTNFSFVNPPMCQPPFDVRFTNTTSGPGNVSYTWSFGDGTTSTQISPQHTYTTEGIYSVTLVSKSSEGCIDSLQKIDLLNLQNHKSAFSSPDTICVNDAVPFTNTSPASASSVLWSFGDGTTSNAINPVKTFTSTGTFTVRLIQTYGICADSASKRIAVSP
ncbi:MAG TPA: PKD domain-containing protein, partial [Flavisolibacter sp.]|nr:PKD domain-containing protein [Flavisolibacter sp.]